MAKYNADLIPIVPITLGLITILNGGVTPEIEEGTQTYYLNHHDPDTPNNILTEEMVEKLFKHTGAIVLVPTAVTV